MRDRTITSVCLVLFIIMNAISCSSHSTNDEKNFTGTFTKYDATGRASSRTDTFVLAQHEKHLEGTYTRDEYISAMKMWCSYQVNGTVLFSDMAELVLTLTEAYPPNFTPEPTIMLHVMIDSEGDHLSINEWEREVPRVE
ncbi:hypothetical protein U14_04685 [Candidatus Moduliflexus flocculans]|uniref:Uncharacterized protein n=1 Tax=Candidatus Moduliflexus flocculans TaxID=1499966 RepID=A0A0S6W4U4_9BACT|nr:hypothetical protein U14_04685 [Candidatus Moduliflexus flocculans]